MIIVFFVDRCRDVFTYLVSGHSLSISLDAFMNVISVERERGR
jgi:hypothetical protein